MSFLRRLAVLLTLALWVTPARAVTLSTFAFSGVCADCTGFGNARLVLSDYTIGTEITDANFVSFAYDGTDLLPAYTIDAGQQDAMFGSMSEPLPGTENFYLLGNGQNFISLVDGYWCTGPACQLDQGNTHVWSAIDAATPVPEPTSLALLASLFAPLLGTAILRRRRAP